MQNRRHLRVSAVLLVLAAITNPVPAAHAGDASTGLLQVPIRWCAVKGSPAAANPGSLGEPDTDSVLWRRHERASDRIWIPGANITFRSALTNQVMAQANFPIIDDPKIGPGVEGDIRDPNEDDTELKQAVAACEKAWDALGAQFNTPVLGPVAVNFREFVDKDGKLPTSLIRGRGWYTFVGANDGVCVNPPSGINSTKGYLGISDYFFLRGFDPDEAILAHELGHVLGLEHGNGLDDNGNTRYDGYGPGPFGCDPTEDVNAGPASLMTPGQNPKVITARQRTTARALALATPGVQIDPPAALINADTISDQRVDPVQDVADPTIDMSSVTMTHYLPTQTTLFSHALFGLLPETAHTQYLVFADLDDDPSTGGDPADLNLGVPTTFQGAELVTRVLVSRCCGEFPSQRATPTVWRFQGGAWVEMNDPSIIGRINPALTGDGVEVVSVVSIHMADAVRGPAGDEVRIQAFAQQVENPSAFDVLPDGPDSSSGAPLALVQPPFPVCAATPSQARPGEAVTVAATGLHASQMAKVFLGDIMVGGGNTDAAGGFELAVAVPFDAAEGPRLVTVGVVGTALTADCTLQVVGPPLPAAADLQITKTRSPSGDVQAGTNVTYTVTVTNAGPAAATSVTVTDVLPAGTAFVSATAPAGWSCSTPAVGQSGTVMCTKGLMAATESATFAVVGAVGCDVPNATVIVNSASASAASPNDPTGGNNSATASVTVANPAPVVTVSVGSATLPQNNHDLVNVGLAATVTDGACQAPAQFTVQVFSDEDDETSGTGEDRFSPDARNVAVGSLRLRQERLGTGDGRVYLVVVKATDAAGSTGFGTATVVVPKSPSAANLAAVQAQAAAAKAFADSQGGTPPAGYVAVGDGPVVGPKQ